MTAAVVGVVLAFTEGGVTSPGVSLWRPHQVIGLLAVGEWSREAEGGKEAWVECACGARTS